MLEDDAGLAESADDAGRSYVPVWPHSRYAEAAAIGDWAGTKPTPIEIHDWVDDAPGIAEKDGMIAAFPTEGDQGYIVPPLGTKADLEQQLSLYEPD